MNTPRNCTVNLTADQINTLVCYILMTTDHRKNIKEAWLDLAKKRNDDGSPMFKHATSNAAYYDELERQLDEIRHILDNSY